MEAIRVTQAEAEALLAEHFPCPEDWPTRPAGRTIPGPVIERWVIESSAPKIDWPLTDPTQGGLRRGARVMERVMTKLPHRTKILGRYVRFAPIVKGERPAHDLDMEAEWTLGAIAGDVTFVRLIEAIEWAAEAGTVPTTHWLAHHFGKLPTDRIPDRHRIVMLNITTYDRVVKDICGRVLGQKES